MGHRCWRPLPQTQVSRGNLDLISKRVPGSPRTGLLDRTQYDFLLVFYSNFGVSVTVSVLQSILSRNDLARRL